MLIYFDNEKERLFYFLFDILLWILYFDERKLGYFDIDRLRLLYIFFFDRERVFFMELEDKFRLSYNEKINFIFVEFDE